jgi:hypothetical protein
MKGLTESLTGLPGIFIKSDMNEDMHPRRI